MKIKETLTKQKLQQEVVRWERVLASSQDPKPILYQLKRAKSRLKSFEIAVDTHH